MIPNAIKLIMTPKQGYHIASDETLTYHTLTPLDGCSPGLLKNGIKIKCAGFLTWKIKNKTRCMTATTQIVTLSENTFFTFIFSDKCAGLHIPNPENPMTDAMSPSSLVLPVAVKEVSALFTVFDSIVTISFSDHFRMLKNEK